ncbi:MAG: SMP-30/gluconolactonase/LRE family protein [Pseudomonadales bacterium]
MPRAAPKITTIATGLRFPEGPIALPDGDVLVVEIARGSLSRVRPDGSIEVVANLGGGPNGAAIGPDGACYVCNNGGFQWIERNDRLYPGDEPENYGGGRIERVDLESGEISVLYSNCEGQPLRGPNDLVFDDQGGFWFTDHGKNRARERDITGVYYAKADGSFITEALFPLQGPNGIGLSPDERELYVAETQTARVWAYALEAPGVIANVRQDKADGGRLLPGRAGYYMYDSLAVDGQGNVCVATLIDGGITILAPKGSAKPRFVPMPDVLTTNICFGGKDLQTAFVTLSSTGQLVSMPWKEPGLPLNFLNK